MLTFDEMLTEDTGRKRGGRPLRRIVRPCAVKLFGYTIAVIPAGFESDGMSRPGILAWKWNPWRDRYAEASVFHDHLLENTDLPKWAVDWLFMGALRSRGVSALEAGIFWLAVRTKRSR